VGRRVPRVVAMTPGDVLTRASPPPDLVLPYGARADQIADVRLPPSRDPSAPLVMFLHGGFWRAAYDRSHIGPLATALAAAGYLVCVPEFRRTGQPSGGWPGTFDDVAAAVDTLPAKVWAAVSKAAGGGATAGDAAEEEAAAREAVGEGAVGGAAVAGAPVGGAEAKAGDVASGAADVGGAVAEPRVGEATADGAVGDGAVADRAVADAMAGGARAGGPVLLAGHSAGGHLALWAAARHRLPAGNPWHTAVPASGASGVVTLAAVSDLAAGHELDLGQGAVAALLGGGPREQSGRYAVTDPARLLPLGRPAWLVHGTEDDRVPAAMSRDYAARAQAAGDETFLDELPGTGHFEVIDPLSAVWPRVLATFRAAAPPAR
jgi:acetyl esterase/lipase